MEYHPKSQPEKILYDSALLNAGCDSFFVEFTMGHKIDRTKAAYFRSDPTSLAKIYGKYVPYLTIQKEADISESPEYLRVKQENQILQAETARHVVERSELQELRAEVERIKEAQAGAVKITDFALDEDKKDPMILKTILEVLKTVKN